MGPKGDWKKHALIWTIPLGRALPQPGIPGRMSTNGNRGGAACLNLEAAGDARIRAMGEGTRLAIGAAYNWLYTAWARAMAGIGAG